MQSVASQQTFEFPERSATRNERLYIGLHIFIAFAALSIGILLGPAQMFRRAPALAWEIPVFSYYYQSLTLHGVLNALVFTTFFIMGISYFVTQRALQRPLKLPMVGWAAFALMTVGLLLAAFSILRGTASVLYTFYPPMEAEWPFYLGLALVIVGSWVGSFNVLLTYLDWRKEHPGEPVPLVVYAIIANFIMWFTASLGVAIEVLTMLLPLSLGIIDTTDPQVGRVLFWFFGHPLVYFWLIPAYASWYTMLPKQLGVRLFSDSMARVAFLMLMIFSIPIGVHHLFVDPGVSASAKMMHSFITFIVAFPSFLTAFNIAATMERSGRKRGATGALDWLWKQPWGNPVVAAQFGGMILFLLGGITGLMNASFNMNLTLHNTTWVPAHFHTTLGGAVVLTYFAITYWLLPVLTGKKLFMPQLATAQAFTWLIGMLIFAGSLGRAGLEGATRRTDTGEVGAYLSGAWEGWLNLGAVGGAVLLLSAILLYVVLIGTIFFSREEADVDIPIDTKAPTKYEHIPMIFERWWLWVAVLAISNLIMWGPVLVSSINLVQGYWVEGFQAPANNPGVIR